VGNNKINSRQYMTKVNSAITCTSLWSYTRSWAS